MEKNKDPGHSDPFYLFRQWYLEAMDPGNSDHGHSDHGHSDPTIMSLATAGADGRPSVRIVLLKEFDERGFVFYTNYRSRKAAELEANPYAALLIHWYWLGQQVRIEGRVEKITGDESDRYFASRLRGSQVGAWASPQSHELGSREELENAFMEFEKMYRGKEIPRPSHWGGIRLIPERFEFWTEGSNRLHDRIVYENSGREWTSRRLAP